MKRTALCAILSVTTGLRADAARTLSGRTPPPIEVAGCVFREDPVLARLLTPVAVPEGTYRAFTTAARLDDVLACYRAAEPESAIRASSSPMQATEIFDIAAPVNVSRLARLFRAARPLVARFPLSRAGRVVKSLTLVSPYPDADLERLNLGTLILLFNIPPAR